MTTNFLFSFCNCNLENLEACNILLKRHSQKLFKGILYASKSCKITITRQRIKSLVVLELYKMVVERTTIDFHCNFLSPTFSIVNFLIEKVLKIPFQQCII